MIINHLLIIFLIIILIDKLKILTILEKFKHDIITFTNNNIYHPDLKLKLEQMNCLLNLTREYSQKVPLNLNQILKIKHFDLILLINKPREYYYDNKEEFLNLIKFKNNLKLYDVFGLFKTNIPKNELYKYDVLNIWKKHKNNKLNFLNVLKPILSPTTFTIYNKYISNFEDITGYIFDLHLEKIRYDKNQISYNDILPEDFKPLFTIGKIFIEFIQTIRPDIVELLKN